MSVSDLEKRADKYLCDKDYESAAKYYREAIGEQGETLRLIYSMGFSLHMLGEIEEAITWYTKLIDRDSSHFNAYMRRGIARTAGGDFRGAEEDLVSALRIDPYNHRVATFLFNALSKQKKFVQAHELCISLFDQIGWSNFKNNNYEFRRECWFATRIPVIEQVFGEVFDDKDTLSVLEIGSMEGMSACWWLDNKLRRVSHLTCIDPSFKSEFYANIYRTGAANRVRLFRGYSQEVLRNKVQGKFDVAYVDGLHEAWAVLFDFLLLDRYMNIGGIVLFDDYYKPDQSGVGQTVKKGVDLIIRITDESYKVITRKGPVAIRKVGEVISRSFADSLCAFALDTYGIKIDSGKILSGCYLEEISTFADVASNNRQVGW